MMLSLNKNIILEHFVERDDKLYYRQVIFAERVKKLMPASERMEK